jgi:polyphenol oxidase
MTSPKYIQPNWPAGSHIRAYTTTREADASSASFEAVNLASDVNGAPSAARIKLGTLKKDLSLPEMPTWLHQVHGNRAVRIDAHQNTPKADASFTQQKNKICAVLTADCLPILLCNRDGTEVAAIHAGWRGLLANVIKSTISAMHSTPDDLMAWMGPALGPEHFQLNHPIYADFLNANPDYATGFCYEHDAWQFNCYTIARLQLINVGVTAIYGGDDCTYKDAQRFYSYRRDNGITGRMASLIFMT